MYAGEFAFTGPILLPRPGIAITVRRRPPEGVLLRCDMGERSSVRRLVLTDSAGVVSGCLGPTIGQQRGSPTVRLQRFESPVSSRVAAGFLSAMLHLGLLVLVALSGGPADGVHDDSAAATELVWLNPERPDRRMGVRQAQWVPATRDGIPVDSLDPQIADPPSVPAPEIDIPTIVAEPSPVVGAEELTDAVPVDVVEPTPTYVVTRLTAPEFLRRVESLAEGLTKTPRKRVTWQHDGRRYEAELLLEPASDGGEPERAVAEISTEEGGRQLRTRITLKRLPFSHFAQVIDHWNPLVQLHDDEITGRMHINSRFNVLHDPLAAPRLLGRVTTAASGFNLEKRGSQRDQDVFLDGIETRAGRIRFSWQWSLDAASQGGGARVHELEGDTRIRFLAGEGYSWDDGGSGDWQHAGWPAGQSVYFVGAPDATIQVQGVVSGKVLVYSPRRIVVEGDITYARDPRIDRDSPDYLGLVCDRDIVIAPPDVTGPGDLHIHAAMFARRRVVVKDSGHRQNATLSIFGSLAAGSLSESEPRYATRVEYDRRFESRRPPGFPSTNRFESDDWDRQWVEVRDDPAPEGS